MGQLCGNPSVPFEVTSQHLRFKFQSVFNNNIKGHVCRTMVECHTETRSAIASFTSASPVLLNLFDHVDLPTLLRLRLSCRSIFQLMAGYQASIIRRLIRRLWPGEDDVFRQSPTAFPTTFRALRRYKMARRLAKLTYSAEDGPCWCRAHQRDFNQPDSELGREVWRSQIRGWLIWQDLADISHTVESGRVW